MKRSIVLGWLILFLVMAWPALADVEAGDGPSEARARVDEVRPALAPPGRCAEPRAAVDVRTGDGFSVVGPVSALFDPVDVAAGPTSGVDPGLRPSPPTARPMPRPGACDLPGSGCGVATRSEDVVEPPPGGGRGSRSRPR